MSQIIHVPAAMLSVSPLNVRKQQDEAANLRLRAHIVARGLLQNLIGIPVPRKKGRYEITAGGRRLTQIHAAIEAKELDPNFLVPVLVMRDREDAEEDSLAENFHRLNMSAAEECIAFQAMIQREKRTPANIAKRWGLPDRDMVREERAPASLPVRENVLPSAAPEKPGISQRLFAELAIQKTELIALHVANDPHFALELGLFIMADRALNCNGSDLPSDLQANAASTGATDYASATQAAQAWAELELALDRSWTAAPIQSERFDAFRMLEQDAKAGWLGWCIARTLRPVDHGRAGADFLDHIGSALVIDAAAW